MALDEKIKDDIKRRLGERAASFVEEGMLVGLGTGSTAFYFIQSLIKRCSAGLKIEAVSSSLTSLKQAREGGIPLRDINDIESIDLVIDGADEVDPTFRLIKGKGGALLREKILAYASKKMIVIVDESKIVQALGRAGLPIEILPFGAQVTKKHLEKLGYFGTLRMHEKKPYVTDNGNYILDIQKPEIFMDPEKVESEIIQIPGVLETGFFFNLATSVLIGYANGMIEHRE